MLRADLKTLSRFLQNLNSIRADHLNSAEKLQQRERSMHKTGKIEFTPIPVMTRLSRAETHPLLHLPLLITQNMKQNFTSHSE